MTALELTPNSSEARSSVLSILPDTAPKKVLVIDDSEDIRMLIAESLNLYGYATVDAGNGRSGIELAKEHLPDLILCDINMPELDGYSTLAALREYEPTATIPFVFLTGAADKVNMRRGMEMGADDYLTKPFTHKELLAAVNARLEKHAERQRQSEKKLEELRGSLSLALPHELRTPLNGILGLAAIMMEDYASMPPQEMLESARFIHESALRLHRLIENFLLFSQIQLLANKARKIELLSGRQPLALDALLPPMARAIASRFQRESDLVLEIPHASLLLPEENFKKVLEELIDNAFKFSEAGKPVRVQGQCANRQLRLTIEDQGRGMSPEQIAKIGPHMQFDRSVYEQQGAGLGLIIAKRLTELLGGHFHIESRPGVGSSIAVSFALPGA